MGLTRSRRRTERDSSDDAAERTLTVVTGLAAGAYDDVVGDGTVTVAEDGTAEITLPAYGALRLLSAG